jgi:hypothetical protein
LLVVDVGKIGMLARVVLVTPHGESAAEPAAPGSVAVDGPVTSLPPQPAAAHIATMKVKALKRTTVIFQPLGLKPLSEAGY